MRTLFWVLGALVLLELAFLIYHFASYEHARIPADIHTRSAYAESLKVYKGRLAELRQSVDKLHEQLNRAGKADRPAISLRFEAEDAELESLKRITERWEQAKSDVSLDGMYHGALTAYGRAGALYMSLAFDTLPEPKTARRK